MTFEEIEKEVNNANSKTDWQLLHSEVMALLDGVSEKERSEIVRTGKWSVIESISMSVLYLKSK